MQGFETLNSGPMDMEGGWMLVRFNPNASASEAPINILLSQNNGFRFHKTEPAPPSSIETAREVVKDAKDEDPADSLGRLLFWVTIIGIPLAATALAYLL